MNWRIRQIVLGSVGGAAVAIAAVVAVTALAAPSAPQSVWGPAATDITGQFAALDDASLPAAPAAITSDFADIHAGIGTARQVGDNAYLASYDGGVCVVFEPGLSGCTDHLDQGVWLLSYMIRAYDSDTAPFNVNLFGVAEDGVSSITFSLADGATTSVPVVNNAFRTTLTDATFGEIENITVNSTEGRSALDPTHYFPKAALAVSP